MYCLLWEGGHLNEGCYLYFVGGTRLTYKDEFAE